MPSGFANDWTFDRSTREAALMRLDALSRLFDVAFAIPGTKVRFGVEAILASCPASATSRRLRSPAT